MVSDTSYDELIEFADGIGIPRRGFQGDHYDIPERYRGEMIAAGAVVVESRELVRRLRQAGLRLSPNQRRARSVGDAGVIDPASPVVDGNVDTSRL